MPTLRGAVGHQGMMIDVKVMQPTARVEALKRAGQPFSQPVVINCLIDTGASISAVDRGVLATLGLIPRGTIPVHTPSTGDDLEIMDTFDVCFILGESESHPLVTTVSVISCGFARQGFLALLGRDVLQHCRLIWDGPNRIYQIEYDP